MEDGRILAGRWNEVAAVSVGTDEAIARESYDLSVDIVLTSPALLKVKSTASGDIKVDLAGKKETTITIDAAEVNEANLHVIKVFKTGTTLATTDFYLWQ